MFVLDPVPSSDIEDLAKTGKIKYELMDKPLGAMRAVTIYRHNKLDSETVTTILVAYNADHHLLRLFYISEAGLSGTVRLTYLGGVTGFRPSGKLTQNAFGYRLRNNHASFFKLFENQYLRTQMTKSIEAAVKECWAQQTAGV